MATSQTSTQDSDASASYRCSCGVALPGRRGLTYNEEAFQYLLAVERRRSQRGGCPFLLLLVDLKEQRGISARMDRTIAAKLFAGLWLCLRDTDFVGWYREDLVAGAVLTELGDRSRVDGSRQVGQRVRGVLYERLPSNIARRLRVRVYQHPKVEGFGNFHSVV